MSVRLGSASVCELEKTFLLSEPQFPHLEHRNENNNEHAFSTGSFQRLGALKPGRCPRGAWGMCVIVTGSFLSAGACLTDFIPHSMHKCSLTILGKHTANVCWVELKVCRENNSGKATESGWRIP